LFPDLAKLNEHIDDHQVEIAARASEFNLAIVVTNQITRQNLIEAKSRSIFGSEQKSDF
jgi:UDP-N-acetylglucosamine transferase subunit ALG13